MNEASEVTEIPQVLKRYMEGLKTHDVALIGQTVADDVKFVSAAATLDKDQFLDMLRALYRGFPDWHYKHDEPQIRDEENGRVIAIKWRQGGTHKGVFEWPGLAQLEPIAPTGKRVIIPEHFFFYKVLPGNGDRIIEIRPEPIKGGAPGGILEQIGISAPPV